ncbi:hypothetical protein L6452_19362 [Arctium lappa]|uniref:Uncharacterized protein n=1 Tax=Arctium lappa TaxID=4217 RepID=A0ACB9BA64_ARCLA|nr:hypothetical protein L6452_19362 [Arctium lappa]
MQCPKSPSSYLPFSYTKIVQLLQSKAHPQASTLTDSPTNEALALVSLEARSRPSSSVACCCSASAVLPHSQRTRSEQKVSHVE